MTLDEQDLRDGLKRIVGTWQPDYLVNFFSNDLAHIPAAEFKSDDGRDFTALTFRFYEDHTMVLSDGANEHHGTWEQTGWSDYRYHLEDYDQIPDGPFKDSAEQLSCMEERLVFAIGFLSVALQKTEEGTVTKEPDIGDLEPTEEDKAHKEIVGIYRVEKVMTMVGEDFGLYTLEEVQADLDRKQAAGELEEEEREEYLKAFAAQIEVTENGEILEWMPIPAGVPQEAIDEALAAGEIKAVRDGFFCMQSRPWKYVKGGFYYDTGEHRELFGEVQSSWDELKEDENGLIPFGSGMMLLKRV